LQSLRSSFRKRKERIKRIFNEKFQEKLRENGEVPVNDFQCYFDLNNLHINEKFQNLIKEFNEHCGFEVFFQIYKLFDRIEFHGRRLLVFLKQLFKIDESFFAGKIIDLYKKVREIYSALIQTIEIKNDEELENMLKNMESFYLNSIINGEDEKYGSLLHFAVSTGNPKAVKILLHYGANQNKQIKEYNSYLFKDIAPPNNNFRRYFKGYLPLHIAALTDNKEMFEILFQNGSENDFKDNFGKTPLHYAAIFENIEMLQYIISENFIDPSIQDNYGKIFKDYINDSEKIEKMEDFLEANHSQENVKTSPIL